MYSHSVPTPETNCTSLWFFLHDAYTQFQHLVEVCFRCWNHVYASWRKSHQPMQLVPGVGTICMYMKEESSSYAVCFRCWNNVYASWRKNHLPMQLVSGVGTVCIHQEGRTTCLCSLFQVLEPFVCIMKEEPLSYAICFRCWNRVYASWRKNHLPMQFVSDVGTICLCIIEEDSPAYAVSFRCWNHLNASWKKNRRPMQFVSDVGTMSMHHEGIFTCLCSLFQVLEPFICIMKDKPPVFAVCFRCWNHVYGSWRTSHLPMQFVSGVGTMCMDLEGRATYRCSLFQVLEPCVCIMKVEPPASEVCFRCWNHVYGSWRKSHLPMQFD